LTEDPHFGFVVAAYLAGFLAVGGMTAAIMKDYADLKRALLKFSSSASLDKTPDDIRPAPGPKDAGEGSA
jgi:heme exporter protein D